MRDIGNEGRGAYVGAGAIGEISAHSFQFCCEHNSAAEKNFSFFKKKIKEGYKCGNHKCILTSQCLELRPPGVLIKIW